VAKDYFEITDLKLPSRLFLGSSGFSSPDELKNALNLSGASIVTMGVKRIVGHSGNHGRVWFDEILSSGIPILPNTAGCRTAKEAVKIAEIACELFETNRIKLEVVGDDFSLQPNPFELLAATKILIKKGISVFPFCTEDIVVAEALVDVGCDVLMPWGSPIGSGQGLLNIESLKRLREKFPRTRMIVDAGIGKPSHACQAMEIGYDAVLLNSAVSQSKDPVKMAIAFSDAVKAGRKGFEAGLINSQSMATPTTDFSTNIFE
tara:strand:+ start:39 stop:824 length:786 start_codon:yes stop_codon:yes gene_type:complete